MRNILETRNACLLVVATTLLAGGTLCGADGGDGRPRALPLALATAPEKTLPPLGSSDARVAQARRLSVPVAEMVRAEDPLRVAEAQGFRVYQDRIQVHVRCISSGSAAGVAALLEREGADSILHRDTRVQAWVRPETIGLLAADDGVVTVERPLYLTLPPEPAVPAGGGKSAAFAGSYVTEGLAAMNGPAWHSAGITGQGMKVGVVDSFAGFESLLGTELPPATRVVFEKIGGGARSTSRHGTACAEIVYDVAPGLDTMVLLEVATGLDLQVALERLRSLGVRVASASIGWPNVTPMDGSGFLQTALQSFKDAGGLYVQAAANDRLATWWGPLTDADGNGWTEFGSGDEIDVIVLDTGERISYGANKPIEARLTWNQWSAPQTDLDLYLYYYDTTQSKWTQVARTYGVQSGLASQDPFEALSYTTTRSGLYGFAIRRYSGPAVADIHLWVDLAYSNVTLEHRTSSMSLGYPADDGNVFSVAALNSAAPFALEPYSSAGPTAGPGGAIAGGRRKPDIASYANVATASYGGSIFNGTSAATPHVAGAALLVWSANKTWTAPQVRAFLEQRAIDLGTSGPDNDYGAGRLWLGAPSATNRRLDVVKAGGGAGTVASDPAGISCGTGCTATFTDGQAVTLVAAAAAGSVFGGWSGPCSGTGSCQLSMSTDRSVTATFDVATTTSPNADFAYSPGAPAVGVPVTFTDRSTGRPTAWAWQFGDGTTSTLQNPVHTFSSARVHNVSLSVSNVVGVSSTSRTVTVTQTGIPVITSFTANPAMVSAGQVTTLSWTSTGGTSATLDHGIGAVPTTGAMVISPVVGATYVLTVTGPNGATTASVTIGSETDGTFILPSSARVQGGNAFWTTDLTLMNTGSEMATVRIRFLGHTGAGLRGPEIIESIPPLASRTFPDVLGSYFSAFSDYGPILVRSTVPTLVVQGQTSTPGSNGGTYGQSVPAVSYAEGISSKQKVICGVRQDVSFRTNLMLASLSDQPGSAVVSIVSAAGKVLASKTVELDGFGFRQLSVKDDFGVTEVSGAAITLFSTTPGARFAAYASVIDNVTQDPRTLLAR